MENLKKYSENTFESIKHVNEYGKEFWYGRELQKVLDYTEWRNFVKVIEKAKETCKNSKIEVSDHIVEVNNMIETGKNAKREVEDFELSRYACYLIVQNADSTKEVIALGQTYFAVQTRRQELQEQHGRLDEDEKRKAIRNELAKTMQIRHIMK